MTHGGQQISMGQASLLIARFIGAVALGVAIGPSLTPRDAAVTAPAAEISQPAAAPVSASRAAAPRARTTKSVASKSVATKSVATAVTIPTSTPALHMQ